MTASLLGIIAQHQVLTPPPATVVGPQRRGKVTSTTWSSATSVTATFGQTPTVGNLLIAIVSMNGLSTTGTCSTPTGWNAGPSKATTSGTGRPALFLFWKLAAASEANPVFALPSNSGTQGAVLISEWAGLDTSAPHLANSTGATFTGAGATSLTDGITTTVANEWVFAVIASSNQNNAYTNLAWTAPLLSFDAPTNNTQPPNPGSSCTQAWASGCYPTPGAQTPQASLTAATGTVATNMCCMSFKLAAGSIPQVVESAFSEYA